MDNKSELEALAQLHSEINIDDITEADIHLLNNTQDHMAEILAERIPLSIFQINGEIYSYEKYSKGFRHFLSSPKNLLLILGAFLFFLSILFSLITQNPLHPSQQSSLLFNIISISMIFFSFFTYFSLKKKRKLHLYNVFKHFNSLVSFFETSQNRFQFIQYVNNNKEEITEMNSVDMKHKLKAIKVFDRNQNAIGFSLIVLSLYNCDLLNFYNQVNSNFHFKNSRNNEFYAIFNFLDAHIKNANELLNKADDSANIVNQ